MLKDVIVKNNLLNMIIYVEVRRVGMAELASQTQHTGLAFAQQIKKE
jgi:hypothetical protein